MPETSTFPVPPDALDRDLVFDFFWRFSAFECALKRTGFLSANPHVAADWRSFAKAIQGKFSTVEHFAFREAVDKLMRLSPKRQILENGKLDWEKIERKPGQSDEEFTVVLLKTVRNNLFHGGKYPGIHIDEIARDRDILAAASIILAGCYPLHAQVKSTIDEITDSLPPSVVGYPLAPAWGNQPPSALPN